MLTNALTLMFRSQGSVGQGYPFLFSRRWSVSALETFLSEEPQKIQVIHHCYHNMGRRMITRTLALSAPEDHDVTGAGTSEPYAFG